MQFSQKIVLSLDLPVIYAECFGPVYAFFFFLAGDQPILKPDGLRGKASHLSSLCNQVKGLI